MDSVKNYKGSIKESLNYSDRLHCDPFEVPVNKDKVEFAKNYMGSMERIHLHTLIVYIVILLKSL